MENLLDLANQDETQPVEAPKQSPPNSRRC